MQVDLGSDTTLCEGDSLLLNAFVSGDLNLVSTDTITLNVFGTSDADLITICEPFTRIDGNIYDTSNYAASRPP